MKSTHPLLIYYRFIYVNLNLYRHLNWNLYFTFSLDYLLLEIVHINRLIYIHWLINIVRLIDIYWLLDDSCWSSHFNLIWHFLLNLYYLLHNSLWTMYEFRNFYSDLNRFFDNNLLNNLFRQFSILILKLLSDYIKFHHHFIVITL